jgi:hypothetical protein
MRCWWRWDKGARGMDPLRSFDAQFDRPGTRFPGAIAIAVTLDEPPGALLLVPCRSG